GFEEIYHLVLAMFAAVALLKPGMGGNLHVEILWRHSVAVAVGSSVLAKEGPQLNQTAFTAGLLHEVGKVIIVSANRGDYATAVLTAGQFKRPVVVVEREQFGFDHAQVGAHLLKRWNLPDDIVAAVRHHHDLTGAEPYERLAAAVYLANLIAH